MKLRVGEILGSSIAMPVSAGNRRYDFIRTDPAAHISARSSAPYGMSLPMES